jgi:hypothetical protein
MAAGDGIFANLLNPSAAALYMPEPAKEIAMQALAGLRSFLA